MVRNTAIKLALLLVAAALLTSPALADTRYIRDVVIVNLRSAPAGSADTLSLLRTGDSFEVLEKEGRYLKVRNASGQVGWIDSQYATAEVPAKLLVRQANAKVERMTRKLEEAERNERVAKQELEETLNTVAAERKSSSRKLNATSSEVGALSKELKKLKKEHAALRAKSEKVIEIDAERERLATENAGLSEKYSTISEKVDSLSDAYALKWFFSGAGVLVLGWVIGVVTGKKKKQRNYS